MHVIAYGSNPGASLARLGAADIQNLSIYADTVTVGGYLWLPQTNVTIYAKKLAFVDAPGSMARIDTTAQAVQR